MKSIDESSNPALRVAEPRCSANIRFSSWLTLVGFNFVWIVSLAAVLTNPKLAENPGARAGLSVTWIAFGLVCVALTTRGVMLAVWISGDVIRVRNYLHTYEIPVDDALEFTFGYPGARIPFYQQAGSLRLKTGDVRPIAAISEGTLFSSGPSAKSKQLLEDLNAVVRAEAPAGRTPAPSKEV